ncbi:MAG: hypothetical protein JXM73_15390 [Anaerolineae bacterium]|nr:hypothetical protein [Anaerolineae bacterium]
MAEGTIAALYGNSLFMAGVEASLKDRQGLSVLRIDAALPSAQDDLQAICPDVVIFDLDGPHAHLILSFIRGHPGLPLLGLGLASNDAVLLSSCRYVALSADDLAQMIQSVKKDGTEQTLT